MSDYGAQYTARVQRGLEIRLQRLFTEAQSDMLKKLDGFTAQFREKDKRMLAKLEAGEITKEKYDRWVAGQVFQGAQWEQKLKDMTDSLSDYYGEALEKIHDKQIDVFSKNANYQAYCMDHDIGKDFGFDLYDADTVERLVKENPELLPRKIVDRKKHNHWNQGIIDNCITQGVIQGESIPQIARRISNTVANAGMNSATLYARTAMTSAQNGGRMERLKEAKEMGINVKKQWLAIVDGRTRDSHIHLDGQIQDVSKPFKSDFGKLDFPGDPKGAPADVYNCRCTLVYVFPEHEDMSQYPDWERAKDMTYPEWEKSKRANRAKTEEDEIRRENELLEMRELAQKYGIDGDVEDPLVSALLADAVIKDSGYRLPRSKWSGRVPGEPKALWNDGEYDMDTHDIFLRRGSWFESSLHEQLHSRSRGLSYEAYVENRNMEEACVETLTRSISSRLGVHHATEHRSEVEALRQIASLTDMTPAQLASELIDMDLAERYNALEKIVDRYEKSGEADSIEISLFRHQLHVLEGVRK